MANEQHRSIEAAKMHKSDNGTVPIGNYYDKYGTRNPIARYLMNGFMTSFDRLVAKVEADRVHEVGCGEGNLSRRLAARFAKVHATDFSPEIIAEARAMTVAENITFEARSIYDLDPAEHSAPLIVCCEVLEHLPDPEAALEKLQALASGHIILSVPREPIWCMMNMMRGKYWSALGNTPGHLQHWSSRGFVAMVSRYFDVVEVATPLPWTMMLCRARIVSAS